jgi:hypothetical protein
MRREIEHNLNPDIKQGEGVEIMKRRGKVIPFGHRKSVE